MVPAAAVGWREASTQAQHAARNLLCTQIAAHLQQTMRSISYMCPPGQPSATGKRCWARRLHSPHHAVVANVEAAPSLRQLERPAAALTPAWEGHTVRSISSRQRHMHVQPTAPNAATEAYLIGRLSTLLTVEKTFSGSQSGVDKESTNFVSGPALGQRTSAEETKLSFMKLAPGATLLPVARLRVLAGLDEAAAAAAAAALRVVAARDATDALARRLRTRVLRELEHIQHRFVEFQQERTRSRGDALPVVSATCEQK